jgi:transketolase
MRYRGLIDETTFRTYCRDGSLLGAHPEFGLPGVEVGTGSLGQGLSVACGLALALHNRRSPARVVALLSDAECNEGQVWEAAQFAAHRRLDNLIAILDANGMQAMGPTRDILDVDSHTHRWAAFGWRTIEVDGHDADTLADRLDELRQGDGRPTMLVARTQLGHGVPFMEDRHEWHYRNLTATLYDQALEQIGDVS